MTSLKAEPPAKHARWHEEHPRDIVKEEGENIPLSIDYKALLRLLTERLKAQDSGSQFEMSVARLAGDSWRATGGSFKAWTGRPCSMHRVFVADQEKLYRYQSDLLEARVRNEAMR